MLDPARGHQVRKVSCGCKSPHLRVWSHLVVVCIFYEHVYCFISPSLSPVTPGADVDTREKIWPKYFDLKHCSCKQLGEASPDRNKQIALVKQIKHRQCHYPTIRHSRNLYPGDIFIFPIILTSVLPSHFHKAKLTFITFHPIVDPPASQSLFLFLSCGIEIETVSVDEKN